MRRDGEVKSGEEGEGPGGKEVEEKKEWRLCGACV